MNFKSIDELKSLSKSERKDYINKNGGFMKLKCNNVVEIPTEFKSIIPEGMTYVEGVISTDELNMNGYKIDIKARDTEAINGYLQDRNGLVYYQHDMDNVIGKTLWAGVVGNELQIKAYIDDKLIDGRFANGLSRDFSTGHYTLEVEYENEEGRITEREFEAKEQMIFETSKDYTDLMTRLGDFYNSYIMVVTRLIRVEYSLVNVGSNKSAKVKKYSNSMDAILGKKGYNSLSSYLDTMTLSYNTNNAKPTDTTPTTPTNEGGSEGEEIGTTKTADGNEPNLETETKSDNETETNEIIEEKVEEAKEEEEVIEEPKPTETENNENISENEGETPKVVIKNSLEIQTLQNKVSMLEKALETNNLHLEEAMNIIEKLKDENKLQSDLIKQAEEITIKNGLYVITEEDKPVKIDSNAKKLLDLGYKM